MKKKKQELESKLKAALNINDEELLLKDKDGLIERYELLNKKFVTSDGRQLLKEIY